MLSYRCHQKTRNAALKITKHAEGDHCSRSASAFLGSSDSFRFSKVVEQEYIDLLQDATLCSPDGRDCIETYSGETFECQASCEGLYADVGKFEVEENEQYNKIVEEYVNYKRSYVSNIRFNGSAASTFFSKCTLTKKNLHHNVFF